jgi:hypothetical protein
MHYGACERVSPKTSGGGLRECGDAKESLLDWVFARFRSPLVCGVD